MGIVNGPAEPPNGISHGDAKSRAADPARKSSPKAGSLAKSKLPELYSNSEQHALRVRAKKRKLANWFVCETLMYFCFLGLFCVVTFVFRSGWSFHSADVVRTLILRKPYDDEKSTFEDGMNQPAKFWAWMERSLLPVVFPTFNYNGEPLTPYDRLFAAQQNRVLGAVRMRQVRSQVNRDCVIDEPMKDVLFECYAGFSSDSEDSTPFGLLPNGQPKYGDYDRIAGAFEYRTKKELCGRQKDKYCSSVIYGRRNTAFSASGYAFDFVQNSTQAMSDLKALEAAGWIDRGTRAVMIDFTFFNPNVRLLIASQLLVEFFPTGLILTKASIKPTEILALSSVSDYTTLILESVLVLWVLVYISRELLEFYSFARVRADCCVKCIEAKILREGLPKVVPCPECGREFNTFRQPICPQCQGEVPSGHRCWYGYFMDPWNWLDMGNLALLLVVFSMRFVVRFDLQNQTFNVRPDEFLMYFPIAWEIVLANYFNSANVLLCFLKTFKYLGKFNSLSPLVRTLFVAAKGELKWFLVIFLVVFGGFGLSFHLAFGTDVEGFRDWTYSMITLFQMLLGDFDYDELERSHRVLAPIFFVLYQLLVFFVLANMFIAIISGAHAQAKEETSNSSTDLLGSALTLFWHENKAWLFKFKLFSYFRNNNSFEEIMYIVNGLQRSPYLHIDSIEDVRTFRYEVEHAPDNYELFASVLHAFAAAYPNMPLSLKTTWTPEDFDILKVAVIGHKRNARMRQTRIRVWDDEDADVMSSDIRNYGDDGKERSSANIGRETSMQMGLDGGRVQTGRRRSFMSHDDALQSRVGRMQQGVDDVRALMTALLQKVRFTL